MPADLTRTRLREIAARRDPDELAEVVEMLADDTPVDAPWLLENGWHDRTCEIVDPTGYWAFYTHVLALYRNGQHITGKPTRGQLRCLMLALSGGE